MLLAEGDTAEGDCGRRCRRERLLVVEWRWDSAAEARQFARILPAYLIGGLGAEPRGEEWALEGGWIAASAAGETTRLGFAPTRRLAQRAADGPPGGA